MHAAYIACKLRELQVVKAQLMVEWLKNSQQKQRSQSNPKKATALAKPDHRMRASRVFMRESRVHLAR